MPPTNGPHPPTFVKHAGEHVNGPHEFLDRERVARALNAQIPSKPHPSLRLMTYNIHFFKDALKNDNMDRVFRDVRNADPDVVAFQEFPDTLTPAKSAYYDNCFVGLGYRHVVRCNGESFAEIGNVLYSRLPLHDTIAAKYKASNVGRCVVSGVVNFANGKSMRITGTHLEVQSPQHRLAEVEELLVMHAQKPYLPRVILGDFNCTYDSEPVQKLLGAGYKEAFRAAGCVPPNYTCWTGTTIDFAMIHGNVSVLGAYVYHTSSSDHVPVVVDIRLD